MHTVLIPRQNLDFMLSWLEPKLDGDELATTSAVLDVAEELAADAFLSHYKQADQSEPRLERMACMSYPPSARPCVNMQNSVFLPRGLRSLWVEWGFRR